MCGPPRPDDGVIGGTVFPMNTPVSFQAQAARFEAIREATSKSPDALVPRSIMRGIAAGCSRAPDLRRSNPLKSRQQRTLWAHLVDEATARPEQVGFVLPDGGLKDLAERLGVPQRTLSGHLETWRRTRPRMVQVFAGRKSRGVAPLVAVQIPVATDLILWAAAIRSEVNEQDGRALHPLLVADAVERLAMLGSAGPVYKLSLIHI